MSVYGNYAVGVFVYDYAARIHTESSYFIFELFGAVDDLALVKFVG